MKTLEKVILVCLLVALAALAALAQDVPQNAAKPTPTPAPKVDEKKTAPLPESFSIPEVRADKARLLSKDVELAALRMAELKREFEAQQSLQQSAMAKLQAEMASAMKLAGVEEKDFPLYEFNRDTLVFTKRAIAIPPPK